ncbi:MAG: transposase [Phycisphaeraceae bacterium]|nr:transposase [Phycisphaeraceae bacterium]
MEKKLSNEAISLSDEGRQIVEQTIRNHCEIRHWTLRAINVRTNHVHVVVSCPESVSPEEAMSQFKAWSTRRLREAKLVSSDARVWVEHGSTRWLNNEEGYRGAVDYVLHGQ